VAAPKPVRCYGCGAVLQLGPERCPLCGTEARLTGARHKETAERADVEGYQANLRALRKKLQKLRREAV
jgi:predicted amidophosphoribosyltransferase